MKMMLLTTFTSYEQQEILHCIRWKRHSMKKYVMLYFVFLRGHSNVRSHGDERVFKANIYCLNSIISIVLSEQGEEVAINW